MRPEVKAGAEMHAGECILETEMGSADLGIRAQLGEIERGFFDRIPGRGARRGATTESAMVAEPAR
jgi:flagellar assembly protein FliH